VAGVLAVNGEQELPSPLEPLQLEVSISPARGDPKLVNSMGVQRPGPFASRQDLPCGAIHAPEFSVGWS